MTKYKSSRVGNIRPSQVMFTYGIGALVDLPRISVIVTGLDDWPTSPPEVRQIVEDRLLQAVRYTHPDVTRMLAPPLDQSEGQFDPFESSSQIGVPVASFPRWMVCPECRLLAPLSSGLFELKPNFYYPERTAYRHIGCNKTRGRKAPEVIPARFMVACEKGHLDDFPWIDFIHRGVNCTSPILRLSELGPSGEARDVEIRCETCKTRRRLAEAFGPKNRDKMPQCRGRRPHLRDFDSEECEYKMRSIILGASNTWFPVIQSSIAIPPEGGKLRQLVEEKWAQLHAATSFEVVEAFRVVGQLGGDLSQYSNEEVWDAIQSKRQLDAEESTPDIEVLDLRTPEWRIFTNYDPSLNSKDFRLRPVQPPPNFEDFIQKVVLVERLREVRAMIGFTRIDAAGELTDPDWGLPTEMAPLSHQPPNWVPANEVRGEGIFIQFNENKIQQWASQEEVVIRSNQFFDAHKRWREARKIEATEEGFPGMRYVFLHTFTHALMRQFALECGYSSASIRERIYSNPGDETHEPMAGVLIYTAAPDSEGTLGGLVSLGETTTLNRHIIQTLESARLCGSDPLCAEHPPSLRGQTLHAAACHSCLFAPETACERGNKYLDRSTLVQTVEIDYIALFSR